MISISNRYVQYKSMYTHYVELTKIYILDLIYGYKTYLSVRL